VHCNTFLAIRFTSTKEVMFSSLFVSLFVCSQLCAKTSKRICMKFSGKVGSGPVNKWLNFGGDPGIVFGIHINRLHCIMLQCTACTSRHRHSNCDVITSPDLGGGMHCPSASDLFSICWFSVVHLIHMSFGCGVQCSLCAYCLLLSCWVSASFWLCHAVN